MLKPLVIGKSKKSRCFAGVKSLPVDYTANRKAWMNAELFADWLLKLDKQMGKGKQKIILFIDNCSAHNTIPELKWVKVQFLPANTTSKLQPLDQGIIKNFKVLYRNEVVRTFVADIEDGKECSINMLQAIWLIDKCWKSVTKQTVVNCFKLCGFAIDRDQDVPSDNDNELEPRLPNAAAEWTVINNKLPNLDFDDFANVDKGVSVYGSLSDQDILSDDDDNDDGMEQRPDITTSQGRSENFT